MLVTEWNEFRTLDLRKMKRLLRKPVLLDLRNIYDADEARAAGLAYFGVGQGAAAPAGKKAARAKSAKRGAR